MGKDKMTLKELKALVLKSAPKGKDLEAFKKILAAEVADTYNELNKVGATSENPQTVQEVTTG